MSTVTSKESIEYPESDDMPMGETDLHRDWMFRILEILRKRYRGQKVYIASDLLVYYAEGIPSKVVVPDVFVVLDCNPERRRTFKTWEEKRVPDVVFEVTSNSFSYIDSVKKPAVYDLIGVQEYFVYDPTHDYLENPLQGYRRVDGNLREMQSENGVLQCQTLNLGLRLNNDDLEFFDLSTGVIALDGAGAERRANEILREEKEAERAAKEAERAAKEAERLARIAAEQKAESIQKELDALKRKLSDM